MLFFRWRCQLHLKRCIHLLSPKRWSPNVPQPTLRSESRGQVLLALCRAARRKTLLRRNLRGRHLSSVKRMLRTFEAIKRSPFLNPPTACRPISSNFAVRDRLTRGNFPNYTITQFPNYTITKLHNYRGVMAVICNGCNKK